MRRFDVGVGLHGDHIGGERDAARALAAGEVDAACMIDANHLLFVREGTLPAGSTRVLAQTGAYDHCNMTVVDDGADVDVERFGELLLSMSYADPVVRPLLDLEGLTEWRPGRTIGLRRPGAGRRRDRVLRRRGQCHRRRLSPLTLSTLRAWASRRAPTSS